MLEITTDVTTYLGEWMRKVPAPEGACVRLILQKGGLELTVDEVRPGDTTFEHDGAVLLVVDVQVASLLQSKTLEIRDTGQGPQLALR
jgi:hypothetical protein